MIKVIQEINIYEIDGKDTLPTFSGVFMVCSHWNRDSMIVIAVDDHRYTVSAKDLRVAIDNAINTARH